MTGLRRVRSRTVVKATGSAGLASKNIAGGRLIPLVMVDTSGRPAIKELIRAHEFTDSGDCVSIWATPIGPADEVYLVLKFERPVEVEVTIEFDLDLHSGLVDNLMRAGGMYLLHGLVDDTFTSTTGRPRILIELPTTGFEKSWEGIFKRSMAKKFREQGCSRSKASRLAGEFVADWRSTMGFEL